MKNIINQKFINPDMANIIISIVTNKIIISAAVACLVSQLIKFFAVWIKDKKINYRKLWEVGGMPSAHAAVVAALTTAVYLEQGSSALFGITFIISIIFLRDALGLRMTVQRQTSILKRMSKEAVQLRELEGHQLLEVLAGIIIGIIITLMVFL